MSFSAPPSLIFFMIPMISMKIDSDNFDALTAGQLDAFQITEQISRKKNQSTCFEVGHAPSQGPFKYYVIKEVGGWGQKMAIFDDLQYC